MPEDGHIFEDLDAHPVDRYQEMIGNLVEWGWDSNWVLKEATIRDYTEISLEKLRKNAIEGRIANKN